tara:strand:+ start:13413 stop:13772 length:360 start_codon:yes stop_codon:yes gene_type:complete
MKKNPIWKTLLMCVFALFLLFASLNVSAQITAKHFNAEWNETNSVEWFRGLTDCNTKSYTDVGKDPESAKKYKIAVVPTIIIFKDGEEALRFQADLSFKMVATKEEVQEAIDELLMSDF